MGMNNCVFGIRPSCLQYCLIWYTLLAFPHFLFSGSTFLLVIPKSPPKYLICTELFILVASSGNIQPKTPWNGKEMRWIISWWLGWTFKIFNVARRWYWLSHQRTLPATLQKTLFRGYVLSWLSPHTHTLILTDLDNTRNRCIPSAGSYLQSSKNWDPKLKYQFKNLP